MPCEPYSRLAEVYDEIVVDPCHDRWAAFLHDLWRARPGRCARGVGSVLRNRPDGRCSRTARLSGNRRRRTRRDAGPGPPAPGPARRCCSRQTLPDLVVDGVFDAAVCTFDGLNYLTPEDFGATLKAVGRRLRPGGWLVVRPPHRRDVGVPHLTPSSRDRPAERASPSATRWTSGPAAATPDRRHRTRRRRHLQRAASAVLLPGRGRSRALADAGFGSPAVTDEYTDQPATPSTLRATWISRRAERRYFGLLRVR